MDHQRERQRFEMRFFPSFPMILNMQCMVLYSRAVQFVHTHSLIIVFPQHKRETSLLVNKISSLDFLFFPEKTF